MTCQAIILAGGFGTRLQTVVKDLPKPMAPVNGKPFLEYVLNYLIAQQFEKIILSVGYQYEVIQHYFKTKYKSAEIGYSIETEALGTGGAILQSLPLTASDEVAVFNGDSLFTIPFSELHRFHRQHDSELTLALKPMKNFDRYGTVTLDAGNVITHFEEKQFKSSGCINTGVYIMKKDLFRSFQLPRKFSFENDFLQRYHTRHTFYGLPMDDYFIDIGVPDEYGRAQKDFKKLIFEE